MQFYQKIREIRNERRITQQEIANILAISKQHYSLYERGNREMPMHHFITLAKFYNVSLDYLAGLIDEPRELTPNEKENQ